MMLRNYLVMFGLLTCQFHTSFGTDKPFSMDLFLNGADSDVPAVKAPVAAEPAGTLFSYTGKGTNWEAFDFAKLEANKPVVVLIHGQDTNVGQGLQALKTMDSIATGIAKDGKFAVAGFKFNLMARLTDVGAELHKVLEPVSKGRDVVIIAHSAGGLAARQAIENHNLPVDHLFTLATPHTGIPLATDTFQGLMLFAAFGGKQLVGYLQSISQLLSDSEFLAELNKSQKKPVTTTYHIFQGQVKVKDCAFPLAGYLDMIVYQNKIENDGVVPVISAEDLTKVLPTPNLYIQDTMVGTDHMDFLTPSFVEETLLPYLLSLDMTTT